MTTSAKGINLIKSHDLIPGTREKIKGIYAIISIATNECYVGATINLSGNTRTHKYRLRKNNHHNMRMQTLYDKFGIENFSFHILEKLSENSNIYERENYWWNTIKSYGLSMINNEPSVDGKVYGRKKSKDEINKIKKSLTGKKRSLESRIKQGASIKKLWNTDEYVNNVISGRKKAFAADSYRENMSNRMKEYWKLKKSCV